MRLWGDGFLLELEGGRDDGGNVVISFYRNVVYRYNVIM